MADIVKKKITVSRSIGLRSRISEVADELRRKTDQLGKCKARLVKCSKGKDSLELTYEFLEGPSEF